MFFDYPKKMLRTKTYLIGYPDGVTNESEFADALKQIYEVPCDINLYEVIAYWSVPAELTQVEKECVRITLRNGTSFCILETYDNFKKVIQNLNLHSN